LNVIYNKLKKNYFSFYWAERNSCRYSKFWR